MFLKIHPQDDDSYYVNTRHIVALQWTENEWDAELEIELTSGERAEEWDWERRFYDEDSGQWQEEVDEEAEEAWAGTRRQLELFAKKQRDEWAEVDAQET